MSELEQLNKPQEDENNDEQEESTWEKNFGGIKKLLSGFPSMDFSWSSDDDEPDQVLEVFDHLGAQIQVLQEQNKALKNALKEEMKSNTDLRHQIIKMRRGWTCLGVCKRCQNKRRKVTGMIWEKGDTQKCHRPECPGEEVGEMKQIGSQS